MTRKLISLVLALCMIMSCFAIGGISASAATAPDKAAADETITVYFSDALKWGNVNVYYWGTSSDPQYPGTAMTVKETNDYGETVYQAEIPANVTGVIFNGNGNQTVDITTNILNGSQWYTLNEKDGNGYKVGYVEGSGSGQTTTTAPTQSKFMYVSPGAMGNPTQYAVWTWNDNEEGEFVYVQRFQYVGGLKDNAIIVTSDKSSHDLTWDDVTAQTVNFKVESGRYVEAISEKEDDKFKVRIYDGAATTTAPVDEEETTQGGDDTTLADGFYLIGEDWTVAAIDAANKFTANTAAEGEYMLDTTLTAGKGIKVVKVVNGAIANWYPDGTDNEYTVDAAHAGAVTIYFKEAYNGDWADFGGYFYVDPKGTQEETTKGEEETTKADEEETTKGGDDTTLADGFYLIGEDWTVAAIDAANKFTANTAAEGEYMLDTTLTAGKGIKVVKVVNGAIANWYPDGMDNDYTVDAAHAGAVTIYFKEAYNGDWADFGGYFYVEPKGTQEETTKGGEDTTTVPVSGATYVLFGYINGANYSCEENASQASEYVFANGSLTATFTQDSYIAVKTADNANWYMTNGYPGDDKTSATLYNTSVTGNNSNKLKVPGGVEVTITLTDNGDDTFTLAYTTSGEVPTKPSDDPIEVTDGFYLIKPDWSNVEAADKFTANAETEGEYMLDTTLTAGDKIKVVKVANGGITNWYPDGMDNEYTVDAAHAGAVTIYFKEAYNGDWADFGGYFYVNPKGTQEETTKGDEEETTKGDDTTLADGFYLIGEDWTVAAIDAANKFTANTAAEGEYMLDTTLTAGDKIKVVKVANGAIANWYPDGTDNEYTVDAAHAGAVTIYFKEAYNGDWADFGGYFFIAPKGGQEETTKGDDTTVTDGFYLIKPDWSKVEAADKFTANAEAEGEYMLDTTLAEGDKIKVVKVANGGITNWYPDGTDNEYTVDAAHAGTVTIYFREAYNGDWADFGGYFYIAERTVEPTTEPVTEPTTEPVTEPTTEPVTEPVTDPITDGATIKVVVPDSYLQTYKWNSVDLYYTSKSTYAEADHLAMTKTDDVYYVNTANNNIKSIVNASGWSVYSITLTPEQVATLDSSRLVGFSAGNNRSRTKFASANNIFKAAVGAYGDYNTTAASAASFDGYTFVICDSLGSGAAAYTAYAGYWTEGYTTVKFAAPVADTMRSTWDNVNFCYGDSYDNSTAVAMANTLETTKVADVGNMSTLKPGRWYIFAATLDAAQTEAANTAAYVGFTKPGDTNRTAPSKSVLKALTNEFTGTYGDARTLQELEGQVFVVKATATATSLLTFNGEWETEDVYTAHNSDTVRIFFAAPTASKDSDAWNTGVEFYYTLNNSTNYKTAERIEMTEETGSYTANLTGTYLSAISSGDWKLYSVELSEDQIIAIDKSNNVGFIKKGSYNRTSILYTKNITKASKTEDHTYSTKKQTIEAFDDFAFIIDSCADTANERTSYTGFWQAASAKG